MTPSTPPPRSRTRTSRRELAALAAVLLTVVAARVWLVEPVVVESGSMRPTLDAGDVVLVWSMVRSPAAGDLVVFTAPDDGLPAVKRVVGTAGDTVSIRDGRLLVDGERVEVPGVAAADIDGTYTAPVTVPEGHVYVLSDARDRTIDSRAYGPVPLDAVTGRPLVRLWPAPTWLP